MHKLFEIPSIALFLCAFCAFLWLKNLFNQRNPRLMNYLRAYTAHSTLVEDSLQINSFMQNEPNFRKSQVNVTYIITKDYENETLGEHGKNEPKTNPNEAKFKKTKINVTSILTVGYENKPPIMAPKKQSQISKRQKPIQTSLPQRIMKKTVLLLPGKTNPNEPKTNPIKANFRGKKMLQKAEQSQWS
jgi:hypothetical protein